MSEIRLTGYDDDGAVVGGGGGWLADPSVAVGLGPEWQERARLDAAREQRAIEAEEAERRDAAQTRAFLQRHAGGGRSHQAVLEAAESGMTRQERREARREREALQAEGKPVPEHLELNRYTMQREQAEREKAKETTPASQADLGRLQQQQVTKLKGKLHALGGKP